MHISYRCILAAVILSFSGLSVQADTLLIERREASDAQPHPKRGELMNQVESRFGAPQSKSGPVGEPPITRWIYADFSVYFEHAHVITTVANKASADEQGPRPVN